MVFKFWTRSERFSRHLSLIREIITIYVFIWESEYSVRKVRLS